MHGFQTGKGFTFLEKQRGEAGPSPGRGKGLELDTQIPQRSGMPRGARGTLGGRHWFQLCKAHCGD